MEEAKNPPAAEVMAVEEGQETQQEVSIDGLMENLDNPPAEEPAAQAEEEHEEEETQTGEEAQRAAVTEGLKALAANEGCTSEFLEAFTKDAAVHADIAAGKSVESAALAYIFRNGAKAPAAKPAAKKSVPTVKSATGEAKKSGHAINEMGDKDFAELDRRAREALLSGKTVRFD